MVYFGTQSLHSQASAYLFSIIGLLPAWTLHFSQIGLRAVPWIGHDDLCFGVFLHTVCPVRKPSPSAHRVIGSVLEGPLCALRVPCALFSHHSLPWPLCTQAMESWNMLRSFNQLWFYSCHTLASWNYAHPSRTSSNTAIFFLPLYSVALLYLIIVILN